MLIPRNKRFIALHIRIPQLFAEIVTPVHP
jgi:hypothetical protein